MIRIGCAGWSIPSRDAGLFDTGDSALARYATRFDMAEINSSFYKPHRAETYARWAATVPARFRFSVKLPRAITHEARLAGCGPALDGFFAAAGALGRRLGCVLVQLPPSLAFDGRLAGTFFSMLARRWEGPVVCEARHASWLEPRADSALSRYGVARVAADPARHGADAAPGGHRGFAYWRWHGAPRIYYSDYPPAALDAIADAVRAGPAKAWVVFDNTAAGHAIHNAAALQDRMARGAHRVGTDACGRMRGPPLPARCP